MPNNAVSRNREYKTRPTHQDVPVEATYQDEEAVLALASDIVKKAAQKEPRHPIGDELRVFPWSAEQIYRFFKVRSLVRSNSAYTGWDRTDVYALHLKLLVERGELIETAPGCYKHVSVLMAQVS